MLDTLWTRLLAGLERRLPATTLDSWVRPCRLDSVQGDHLRIAAPSKFARDWLAQHHADAFQAVAREVIGGNPRVTFDVDKNASTAEAPEPPATIDVGPSHATGLSARYTFESFVVGNSTQFAHAPGASARYTVERFVGGNSNQFAQAACQAVADLPSKAYNPLFIYGGVGLGKTHLLHAVGHQIASLFPSLRLLYLSSERFTNELINAIRY